VKATFLSRQKGCAKSAGIAASGDDGQQRKRGSLDRTGFRLRWNDSFNPEGDPTALHTAHGGWIGADLLFHFPEVLGDELFSPFSLDSVVREAYLLRLANFRSDR
jgi:hypothetical protein